LTNPGSLLSHSQVSGNSFRISGTLFDAAEVEVVAIMLDEVKGGGAGDVMINPMAGANTASG